MELVVAPVASVALPVYEPATAGCVLSNPVVLVAANAEPKPRVSTAADARINVFITHTLSFVT